METLQDLEIECARLDRDADTMLLSARINKMAKRLLEHTTDYPLLSEVLEGLVHASSCRFGHYPHSRPDRFAIAKRVAGQAVVVACEMRELDIRHFLNLVPNKDRVEFLTDRLANNAEEFPALALYRFPEGGIARQLDIWEAAYAEDSVQYSVVHLLDGPPVEVFPGRKYTYSQAMSLVSDRKQVYGIDTVITRFSVHEIKAWTSTLNL